MRFHSRFFRLLFLAGLGSLLAAPSLRAQRTIPFDYYDSVEVGGESAIAPDGFFTYYLTLGEGSSLTWAKGGEIMAGISMGPSASLTLDPKASVSFSGGADIIVSGGNNRITLNSSPTATPTRLHLLGQGSVQAFFEGSGNAVTINARSQIVNETTFHFGLAENGSSATDNQMIVTGTNAAMMSLSEFIVGETQGSDPSSRAGATLTIQNGGMVQTAVGLILARGAGSSGTLNIGAYDLTNPTTGGTLTSWPSFSSFVRFDGGEGAINFNQTEATNVSMPVGGTGSVTQRGIGTTTLSGDNAGFSGTTTVTAGTLIAGSNTAFGSSAVTVHGGKLDIGGQTLGNTITLDGGTLAGTGTLTGAVTLGDGSTLAPGNSPGTLTFTNGLTLDAGAVLDFQLGTTSDLILVTGGTLTGSASAGGITLNLADAGGFTAASYTLFDFSGATTSSFTASDFTLGSTLAGYTYQLAIVGSTLQLISTASAVPEPSTFAVLAGLSALGLVAYRRRRTR